MSTLRSLALIALVAGAACAADPPPPTSAPALPPCAPQPVGSVYKPGEPVVADAGAPAPPPSTFKKAAFKPKAKQKPVAAAVPECGGKNPCPLQVWMRHDMAPASAASDPERLAAALAKMATFSPVPSWRWNQSATEGADAAKRGDFDAARQACRRCHDTYKPLYKDARYRGRPAPP